MPASILDRYELTADGKAVIDLALFDLEAVYNPLDRLVSRTRRNLDANVANYISECVAELGEHPFQVRIRLDQAVEADEADEAAQSIRAYFSYLQELGKQRWARMVRRSVFLFVLGLALLVLLTAYASFGYSGSSFLLDLSAQGLTVAAWLAIWEAFGAWLLRRGELREAWAIYAHLAAADIAFGETRR